MRYSNFRKAEYVRLCQRYNASALRLNTEGGGLAFVRLSLQIQQAKADVPNRWGLPGFVRSCGTPSEEGSP